jgi:hypothetical protein
MPEFMWISIFYTGSFSNALDQIAKAGRIKRTKTRHGKQGRILFVFILPSCKVTPDRRPGSLAKKNGPAFSALCPSFHAMLDLQLAALGSKFSILSEHNSNARKPVSTKVRMIAWSRLAVGRRITKRRRLIGSASRE